MESVMSIAISTDNIPTQVNTRSINTTPSTSTQLGLRTSGDVLNLDFESSNSSSKIMDGRNTTSTSHRNRFKHKDNKFKSSSNKIHDNDSEKDPNSIVNIDETKDASNSRNQVRNVARYGNKQFSKYQNSNIHETSTNINSSSNFNNDAPSRTQVNEQSLSINNSHRIKKRETKDSNSGSFHNNNKRTTDEPQDTLNIISGISNSIENITCIICCEQRSFVSVGSCDHPICSVCSLRIRFKSSDYSCPVCKQTLDIVIIFSPVANANTNYKLSSVSRMSTFSSFNISANDILDDQPPIPGFEVDIMTKMIFYKCKAHFKELREMRSIKCPVNKCPSANFVSVKSLLEHFNQYHPGSRLCSLCLEHRPLFICEQAIYSDKSYKDHMRNWSQHGSTNSNENSRNDNISATASMLLKYKGHPPCQFCCHPYFDINQLYKHMNVSHITCYLCPASMQYRFYRY